MKHIVFVIFNRHILHVRESFFHIRLMSCFICVLAFITNTLADMACFSSYIANRDIVSKLETPTKITVRQWSSALMKKEKCFCADRINAFDSFRQFMCYMLAHAKNKFFVVLRKVLTVYSHGVTKELQSVSTQCSIIPRGFEEGNIHESVLPEVWIAGGGILSRRLKSQPLTSYAIKKSKIRGGCCNLLSGWMIIASDSSETAEETIATLLQMSCKAFYRYSFFFCCPEEDFVNLYLSLNFNTKLVVKVLISLLNGTSPCCFALHKTCFNSSNTLLSQHVLTEEIVCDGQGKKMFKRRIMFKILMKNAFLYFLIIAIQNSLITPSLFNQLIKICLEKKLWFHAEIMFNMFNSKCHSLTKLSWKSVIKHTIYNRLPHSLPIEWLKLDVCYFNNKNDFDNAFPLLARSVILDLRKLYLNIKNFCQSDLILINDGFLWFSPNPEVLFLNTGPSDLKQLVYDFQ